MLFVEGQLCRPICDKTCRLHDKGFKFNDVENFEHEIQKMFVYIETKTVNDTIAGKKVTYM